MLAKSILRAAVRLTAANAIDRTPARQRHHPARTRPFLELLCKIAGERARRGCGGTEFDLPRLEPHEMDVIFDLHFQRRRAFCASRCSMGGTQENPGA